MNNYTILHLHTMLSNAVTNIDSVDSYEDCIEKAYQCGMTAMAISEHGSVLAWTNKKKAMEKRGMKYIHAEEFYVTESLEEKVRDNYHTLLIAKNYDGVLELNKLSSDSFNREDGHFYFHPRITFDELINTSNNIIVCTACLGGILSKGNNNLRNRFFQFIYANKDRCFLEIQHHQSEEQKIYNKMLYDLSVKYGLNMVMTTDTHALSEESLRARAVMQKSKGIHFSEEDEFDIIFKTYDELIEACKKQNAIPMSAYLEAINNTNVIADMIEPFELTNEYKYPHLWGDNSEQTLREKIQRGLIDRGVVDYPNYQEYLDRIEYEMKAYIHNQSIDFMLLMTDILDWCRENDIEVGYGRGSVNGSVIAWLLHITEMDSIKHKLNFDRFMNVARVSLSDIDTDFPPSRIEDVKQYIYHKHGLYCSDIVTFNTIALKGAIRDVCRALYKHDSTDGADIMINGFNDFRESSDSEYLKIADYICKNVEQNEDGMRAEYPEVFEYVDLVKGTVVSVGSHPCGCVVSPFSVDDRMGIFTTSTSNYPISQINMKEIDALNYVKLDLLRLDTIEIINKTCKRAGIERVTPDNLDITDVKVWNSMRDDTTQIFQWEGDMGNDYIKKLLSDENIKKFQEIDENVDRMTLLSIGNSAIRPAGASYRSDLANGVIRKSGSQAIDDFLKPTFGYLVFQCQIIDFLHEYCGFTMGEADIVRRHFAKKYGTDKDIPIIEYGGYMDDSKSHHIAGFIATMKEKYGMEETEAKETIKNFLQVIEDASNYLFSLNHSQPYSYEGYASAWLRYYYPVEFITEALNINIDNKEKTDALTTYARKREIKIQKPIFRYSTSEYGCSADDKIIYKSIGSIKNIGSACGDNLNTLKDNYYDTFIDLLYDISEGSLANKTELTLLVMIDFFREFGDINYLLACYEVFMKLGKRCSLTLKDLDKYNLTREQIKPFCEKVTEKQFRGVNMKEVIKLICSNLTYEPITDAVRMVYDVAILGYSDITIDCDEKFYIVSNKETNKYGTTFITIYRMCDGKYFQYKVKRWVYNENPCDVGDAIMAIVREQNRVTKNENDEWIKTDIKEVVIKDYALVRKYEIPLKDVK